MMKWIRRAAFGQSAEIIADPPRPEARFRLPGAFAPVPAGEAPAKPHYALPIVRAFQTSDCAVTVRVTTQHDHDGLDYHRKDAKRMVLDAGGTVAFMHFLDDGYSMGAKMGPDRNLHRCVKVFVAPNGANIIGTVDIDFQSKDDPRAVALIRTASSRLSLAEC